MPSVLCLNVEERVDRAHHRRVLEIPVELVGQLLDQRQILVERLLDAALSAPEAENSVRHEEHQQSPYQPFHRKQAQDDQIAERATADDLRRVRGRSVTAWLAHDEVSAPKAPPGGADGRFGPQSLPQLRFVRGVRRVAAATAGSKAPVQPQKMPAVVASQSHR